MNERYLFRGKTKPDGEWIYGGHMYVESLDRHIIVEHDGCKQFSDECFGFSAVIPETVGQCTGLKDKNGNWIFEGDILRLNGNKKDLCIVCFGEFGCIDIDSESAVDTVIGWYYKLIETDALSKTEPFCLPIQINKLILSLTKAEICGSVHDNPELLEV